MDVPLLLYRPGKTPTLIFSPANKTSDEEDGAQLMGLASMLRKQLGRTWQDSWLTENAYIIPRKSLPLSIDSESGQDPQTSPEAGQSLHVEFPADVPADLQEAAEKAALATRSYKNQGDERVLDLAIVAWNHLLRNPALEKTTRAFRWSVYNGAGNAFFYRSRINRDLNDLDQGIFLCSEAVKLAFDPKILALTHLNLCIAFIERNSYTSTRESLVDSIKHYRAVVTHDPASLPQSPKFLTRMGNTLLNLYQLEGHAEDLEDAVKCFQQTVNSTAPDSPDLPNYLKNLANCLHSLFDLRENPKYLEQAIQYHRQALNLLPSDSADLPLYLSNLGAVLGKRYDLTTNLQDLNEAIDLFQEAVDSTPPDSPDYPDYLVNLGTALTNRYQYLGRLQDLSHATERLREAVAHSKADYPDFSDKLYSLGTCLYEWFAYTREVKDLEEAIGILQQAVAKAANELRLPVYLNALSGVILERYRAKGQIVYLGEAIALQRDALKRALSGIPALRRILQYNLGTTLMIRFERMKEMRDIDEAIHLLKETVQNTSANAVDRPGTYITLGGALRSRYNKTKEREDLSKAIQSLRTAIQLLSSDAAELRRAHHDLGNALRDLYDITKQVKYLDEATQCFEKSFDETDSIANRCILLFSFGRAWQDYYVLTEQDKYLQDAKTCYEQACKDGWQVIPEVIMKEARSWGHWAADRAEWEEASQAYTYALQALEALYQWQILQTDREIYAGEVSGLYERAAYAMARADLLPQAILTLEKGRAKTLSEALARDYTNLEDLQQNYPEAYQRYCMAAENVRLLERSEREGEFLHFEHRRGPASEPTFTTEHMNKARTELEAAITHIRGISDDKNDKNFLKEPTFEDICKATVSNTPLVYIAVTPRGSLTLLLHAGSITPKMILEENFTLDHLHNLLIEQGWQQRLQNEGAAFTFPKGFLPSQTLPTAKRIYSALTTTLSETLPLLGTHLIGPIAHHLQVSGDTQVVLLPTSILGLLPLHAATYELEGKPACLMDTLAVAYALSARALTIARQEARKRQTFPPYLLAVGNPSPSPLSRVKTTPNFPFARAEVETIAGFFPPQVVTALYEDEATLEAVWRKLPEATIAHFACHGTFDPLLPLDAALILAQETPLTLRELLNAPPERLARLRLAVLSACQTALTDFRRVPDEAIGLLSGFLQAGIPSVVGTQWPVRAISTALLMVRFYELLFQGDQEAGLSPQVPVHALRLAQSWLRDLTYSDLKAYATHLPGWNLSVLGIEYEMGSDECPYAEPFYWAAFAYYGVI